MRNTSVKLKQNQMNKIKDLHLQVDQGDPYPPFHPKNQSIEQSTMNQSIQHSYIDVYTVSSTTNMHSCGPWIAHITLSAWPALQRKMVYSKVHCE